MPLALILQDYIYKPLLDKRRPTHTTSRDTINKKCIALLVVMCLTNLPVFFQDNLVYFGTSSFCLLYDPLPVKGHNTFYVYIGASFLIPMAYAGFVAVETFMVKNTITLFKKPQRDV